MSYSSLCNCRTEGCKFVARLDHEIFIEGLDVVCSWATRAARGLQILPLHSACVHVCDCAKGNEIDFLLHKRQSFVVFDVNTFGMCVYPGGDSWQLCDG